jgi:DNA-nicking Smr family endonuclease
VSGKNAPDSPDEPAVVLPLTGELDLHAFAPRDVASVVEEYVRACREGGVLELRIVHGRGRGVQRAVVRRLLAALPAVAGFEDAPPASGGWGATRVRLRAHAS